MDYYHYSVELPFSKKTIRFREITTKEQLALGKAQHSFSNDLESHYNFVYQILSKCVDPSFDFSKIDIFEFILILMKIRIISVGNEMEIHTVIDNQNTKITLNLNSLMSNIYQCLESILPLLEIENSKIKLGFPNIEDIKNFIKINPNYSDIIETIPYFVKKTGVLSNRLNIKTFYDNIPASLSLQIQEKILKAHEILSKKEIFGIEVFKDFKLNFFDDSLFELIKLFSSFDVKSIHQEIYLLSKLDNMYVLGLSPLERKIYISFYIQENSTPQTEPENSLSPIEKLENEFNPKHLQN